MNGRMRRSDRRRMPQRPKILEKGIAYYDDERSRIPDELRMSFEDGTTAVYRLKTDDPAPILVENIRIIRKWLGYTPPDLREGAETE